MVTQWPVSGADEGALRLSRKPRKQLSWGNSMK